MITIKIEEIVYDGKVYPRQKPSTAIIDQYADAIAGGAKFPPIILENETNRLLDGYHRWKAYAKVEAEEIECEFHTIPDGITPKLYALSLSSKHGLRPTNKDKELAAREQYETHLGTAIKTIADYTGVSEPTAKKYIDALIAEFEETKRSVIMRLNLLGWTQQEIADKLSELWPEAKGTDQAQVSRFYAENEDFTSALKTDLAKGHDVKTVAKRNALPEIIVWALKLQGMTDQERMEALNIKIQPYDHWSFTGCEDLFGYEYLGRIPGALIAHVLYFFTEPGDMIIDPMSGSGTTQDVCLALGRKCYAYDNSDQIDRPDVIEHDLSKGWSDRVKKADLVFWDPPYFSKQDYGENSISLLDKEDYLAFFTAHLSELKELTRKDTRLAFLMSDWDDDEGDGIFLWDYADLLRKAGWNHRNHQIIRFWAKPLPLYIPVV